MQRTATELSIYFDRIVFYVELMAKSASAWQAQEGQTGMILR